MISTRVFVQQFFNWIEIEFPFYHDDNEDERKGNRNWNGLNLEKQTVNFEK